MSYVPLSMVGKAQGYYTQGCQIYGYGQTNPFQTHDLYEPKIINSTNSYNTISIFGVDIYTNGEFVTTLGIEVNEGNKIPGNSRFLKNCEEFIDKFGKKKRFIKKSYSERNFIENVDYVKYIPNSIQYTPFTDLKLLSFFQLPTSDIYLGLYFLFNKSYEIDKWNEETQDYEIELALLSYPEI